MKLAGHLHRLAAGFGFPNYFEILFRCQQRPQPLSHDHMIIGQQNRNLFHGKNLKTFR